MHLSSVFLFPGLLYGLLYLADTAARLKCPVRYARFIRATGFEIGLFQVRWYTERFNRTLHRFGRSFPSVLSAWFLLGAIISSLTILPAIYMLSSNLVTELGLSYVEESEEGDGGGGVNEREKLVIQAVVPGVNIPNSELGYYFLSLLVCSVYHEVGHAVSAVSEDVRVLGFGVFILFLVPAAYVDLPTDQLMFRSKWQRLRVFSAGVWHNIILTVISYLLMSYLPVLLWPVYSHGHELHVVHVVPDSPVSGPSGLHPGDLITHMQGKRVQNKTALRSEILESLETLSLGLCVPTQALHQMKPPLVTLPANKSRDKTDLNCCDFTTLSSSLCFHLLKLSGENLASCLPARGLVEASVGGGGGSCLTASECQPNSLCAVPVLSANNTRFIQIRRANDKDFLYVGNPALIYTSVQLTDYSPRYSFLPTYLPECMLKLLSYITSFSSALALLNVVPSLLLDGQHMIVVLLDLILVGQFQIYRKHFQVLLTALGTALVVINIGIGFYRVLVMGGSSNLFTAQ